MDNSTESSLHRTEADLATLDRLLTDLEEALHNHHQAAISHDLTGLIASSSQLLHRLSPIQYARQDLQRQFERQRDERARLMALQAVGATVNSSLDVSEVLNEVMDAIIDLTGAERGFLMLTNVENELEVRAARNMDRQTIEGSEFEISRSIVRRVADSGEPVVTTDAQEDPRFSSQASIISYNLRSILCVPLKIKSLTTGVIYADNRLSSGIFGPDDRDILSAFADQAAVAVENARLFRQTRATLDRIIEMKSLMDDVFASIPSGVITIDAAERVSLFNRAAGEILGVDGDQVHERPYREALSALQPMLDRLIEQVKRQVAHQRSEVTVKPAEGPGPATLNLTCSPLQDVHEDLQGFALVVDDITEKKRLDSARRYLPPALVDRIVDLDAAQQPQRRRITTLFADIRGFSAYGEKQEPEQLIELINIYFTLAARSIMAFEGVIDKFMGDAVMATFNTTLNPQGDDHVARAVRTALAIRRDVLAHHDGVPAAERLNFGMGIHVGEAVVGNVGSPFRKDYSAIGDAVNIAKRLQEMAGPDQILISQDVYDEIQEWVTVRSLGLVEVKGRQGQLQVYELLSVVEGSAGSVEPPAGRG